MKSTQQRANTSQLTNVTSRVDISNFLFQPLKSKLIWENILPDFFFFLQFQTIDCY